MIYIDRKAEIEKFKIIFSIKNSEIKLKQLKNYLEECRLKALSYAEREVKRYLDE